MRIQPQSPAYGRLAGILYLVIAFVGFFSIMYVPGEIISDEASETVRNLQANIPLFRWGIAADILTFSLEIVLTVLLYQIFRRVDATLATIAAYARGSMIVIMGINLLIYLTPMLMLENPGLQAVFEPSDAQSLIQLFFDIHAAGILVWGIFFGIHLVFLGLLVKASSQHPTILGWLMLIGSFGYILESINAFCFGANELIGLVAGVLLGIVVLGEVGFAIWLVVKGINMEPETSPA